MARYIHLVSTLLVRAFVVPAIALVSIECGGKKSQTGDKPPRTDISDGGASVAACSAKPSLRWPLRGRQGRDWVITSYVDVDPGTGSVRDYSGASGRDAATRDGHDGVDIDIPSFRQMDRGAPVLAAAAGTVVASVDDQPDRNTSCTGKPNLVSIRHASGYEITYSHLKKGSVAVKPGAPVKAGAILGAVGSSGCSEQPHLQLTVKDCNGKVVSPFARELWKSPRDYAPALRVMDVMIRDGGHESAATVKAPAPDPTGVPAGSLVGFGVTTAGGSGGDTVGIKVLKTDGSVLFEQRRQLTRARRHSFWYWNHRVPDKPQILEVRATVNGYVGARRRLIVTGGRARPAAGRRGGTATPARP